MTKTEPPFFEATSIFIGFCKNPGCVAVHIQLQDPDGETRAQGVLACEDIEDLIVDLRQVRDQILGGTAPKGMQH